MTNKQEEKPKEEETTKTVVKKELAPAELDDLKKHFSTPFIGEKRRLREYDELDKLEKPTKEQQSKKEKLSIELALLNGLDNGIILQNIVSDMRFSNALVKIRKELAVEHQCKNASELMLVDRITTAYWRGMRYEMYLNRLIEPEPDKFLFNEFKIKALKEIHKGIELSNRQFETALTMLKNLKQPRLNVRVTADNAYLAQNQQIINTDEVNPAPKENH